MSEAGDRISWALYGVAIIGLALTHSPVPKFKEWGAPVAFMAAFIGAALLLRPLLPV